MTDAVTPTEALTYYKNAILCSLSTQKWLERNGGTPQEIKTRLLDARTTKTGRKWSSIICRLVCQYGSVSQCLGYKDDNIKILLNICPTYDTLG